MNNLFKMPAIKLFKTIESLACSVAIAIAVFGYVEPFVGMLAAILYIGNKIEELTEKVQEKS